MEATTVEIVRSLFVIYRQMSPAVQQEFRQLIAEDDNDEWRMKIANETLRDDWNSPENDIWDELYARQSAK